MPAFWHSGILASMLIKTVVDNPRPKKKLKPLTYATRRKRMCQARARLLAPTERAAILRKARTLLRQGASLLELVEWLKKRGKRLRRTWGNP